MAKETTTSQPAIQQSKVKKIKKYLLFIPFVCVAIISLILYWLGNIFGRTWRPEEGVASKDHPFLQFFDLIAVILFFVAGYYIFRTDMANRAIAISPLFVLKIIATVLLLLLVIGMSRVANSVEWKEWPLLNNIATKFARFQKAINQNLDN